MPPSINDLAPSFANSSVKHGSFYNTKDKNTHNHSSQQQRRKSHQVPKEEHQHHQQKLQREQDHHRYHNHHQQLQQPIRRASASSSASATSALSSSPSIASSTSLAASTVSSDATATTTINNDGNSALMLIAPPTLEEVDMVRCSWEKVCECRHPNDDPSVSAAHAFGLCFYNALFDIDPTLKTKFGNVLQQARALAGIMSYMTRSPTIKGEAGSIRDINAANSKLKKRPSFCSYTSTASSIKTISPKNNHSRKFDRHYQVNEKTDDNEEREEGDDEDDEENHIRASRSPASKRNYTEKIEKKRVARGAISHPSPPSPPPPPIVYDAAINKYDDDVCPFHRQELEEKYQQLLLLQQQHQEELDRCRSIVEQDFQHQLQKKALQDHQEENQWFAYKLRELGIQHLEDYDLVPQQLDALGPALISALRARLQSQLVSPTEQAWIKTYTFTFYHMKMGMEAHLAYHRRARRLSSGSYCSIEAGETNGVCIIQ